jgi:Fe(3+) dicitrate transport protein
MEFRRVLFRSPGPAADEPSEREEGEGDADGLLDLSADDVLHAERDDDLRGDDLLEDAEMSDLVDSEEDLQINGVVVSATPIEDQTGRVVQQLDAELLERFNYDNAEAIVQMVPGAYVRQEDGYGLRPNIGLRGVSSERSARITLMEDGVLFGPAPYAAPAGYYFPLMTRFTAVDVYVGAATIPYGPMTVGGAIDFRSRPIPEDASGGLDLALGLNNFGRAHAWGGVSNSWGGFSVEGVFLRSDGFKHISGVSAAEDDTGFDRAELLLRGQLRGAVSDDVYQRLELRVGLAGESSSETYLGLTNADFADDPYARYPASRLGLMEWWRTQVQLRHTLEVGDGFTLRSVAYRHDLDRAWLKVNSLGELPPTADRAQRRVDLFDVLNNAEGGRNALLTSILRGTEDGGLDPGADDYVLIGTNARRFGVTGVQTEGIGRFATGPLSHIVRGGVRLHHDAVDRHHTEDAFSTIAGNLVRATPESYTTLRTHVEALALSLHAAWAVTLLDRLTVTPAIRAELVWTSFEDMQSGESPPNQFRDAFIPGVLAEGQIIDELAVFAGVMRGFAPVAPGQAATVQSQDSIAYEAGLRLQHDESRTSALVTGFVSDYSNYLQQCSFSAGCGNDTIDAQANGGRPLVAGVDLRVGATPRVGEVSFPLRAAYTFTFSELREDIPTSPSPVFFGAVAGDAVPYVPLHQVNVQAGFEYLSFGLNVSGSYVSEMLEAVGRFDEPDAILTDQVFLLDAVAYVQPFEDLRIYVRGTNLTMTQAVASRRPFGARPVRPFQLQVGVRVAP